MDQIILFGILMLILTVGTGYLGFTSKTESQETRWGFLTMSLGFLIILIGIFSIGNATGESIGTFTVGAGAILTGFGYKEHVPKILHIMIGIVVIGIGISRYIL